MRDNAPSITTRSMLKRCLISPIHRLRPDADDGPERRILPPVRAWAVTTRPSEVLSSLTSMSSETSLRWR